MQREKCFSPSLLLLPSLVFLSPKSSHLQSSLLRTFLIRRAHNRFTLPFIINVERITLLQGGKLGSILDCCCCYCSFAVWWRCALADSGCQRGTHCCCYYESSRQGPWQQWSAFAKLVILFLVPLALNLAAWTCSWDFYDFLSLSISPQMPQSIIWWWLSCLGGKVD